MWIKSVVAGAPGTLFRPCSPPLQWDRGESRPCSELLLPHLLMGTVMEPASGACCEDALSGHVDVSEEACGESAVSAFPSPCPAVNSSHCFEAVDIFSCIISSASGCLESGPFLLCFHPQLFKKHGYSEHELI